MSKEDKYVIYAIINKKNYKTYIGQTKNFKKRMHQHFSKKYKKTHGKKFEEAIEKYGTSEDVWLKTILETNVKDPDKRERYYQSLFDSVDNGYNTLKTKPSKRHSPESKKKHSEGLKKRYKKPGSKKFGADNPATKYDNFWEVGKVKYNKNDMYRNKTPHKPKKVFLAKYKSKTLYGFHSFIEFVSAEIITDFINYASNTSEK